MSLPQEDHHIENEEIKRKAYKRLSKEELAEILRLKSEGIPVSILAERFSITERQIHRIFKNSQYTYDLMSVEPKSKKKVQSIIQEQHSAYIYEELLIDPHVSLDFLSEGLLYFFGVKVSHSTIWRHIRGGGLEAHGFPGFTKVSSHEVEDQC